MPRLRLFMDPAFCSFFRSALHTIIDAVSGDPIESGYRPADDLDGEIWVDGLQEHNHEIAQVLRELVARREFGVGEIELPSEQIISVVQACSYYRLRIRNGLLGNLSDEDLENGRIEIERLTSAVRDAYIVYMCLAQIQSEGVDTLL